MTTIAQTDLAVQVYQVFIKASPEQIWDAITKSEFTTRYFFGSELESELEMTRFGVMKHLRVLEDAGLVVTRKQGREKLHFLNPVPIRLIHDRWIDKYTERHVSALAQLKTELEETA